MRREERLRRINENMQLFGELPDDYEEFTNNAVFRAEHLLIRNPKTKETYCTGCKQTTPDKLFKVIPHHNKEAVCPCCGRLSLVKTTGRIKNGFEVVKWSVMLEKNEEMVLARYVCHSRKYKPDGTWTQNSREMMRQVFTKFTEKAFGRYSDGWSFVRKPPNYFGWSIYQEPRGDAMLYNLDITETLRDTVLEYSGVDYALKNWQEPYQRDLNIADNHLRLHSAYVLDNWFETYQEHHYMEQLAKLGMMELAKEVIQMPPYRTNCLIDGKKRIHEILGVTRETYKVLRQRPIVSMKAVGICQKMERAGIIVTDEELTNVEEGSFTYKYDVDDYIITRKFMSPGKAYKWLSQHGKEYADYLDMASRLKWNMKSKTVLFPRDVKKAHDLAADQFNKQKQMELSKKLLKVANTGIYSFESDDYVIVIPKSGADLVNEGKKLHHCVAGYTDKVLNGITMILFIRKKNQKENPFYTMEWKNNHIVQCRGLKNCDMTPEVKKFATDFENHMKGVPA